MTNTTETTGTITVSPDMLRAIRAEAGEHGDTDQVRDCDAALSGDAEAMTRVAEAASSSPHASYVVIEGDLCTVGDCVEGGQPGTEDYDYGTIQAIEDGDVTVAWRGSETTTTQSADALRSGWSQS